MWKSRLFQGAEFIVNNGLRSVSGRLAQVAPIVEEEAEEEEGGEAHLEAQARGKKDGLPDTRAAIQVPVTPHLADHQRGRCHSLSIMVNCMALLHLG